jgi:beta-glucosidase
VDAVMSAHLLIKCWDAERPATLSQRILTQQLREQLAFEGLIVTDALVMGAIANRYGANVAPVLAVEAGADILLMPINPEGAIQAVCEAVATGRISPERIRASVERIWRAKLKVCSTPVTGTSDPQIVETALITSRLAQPDALTNSYQYFARNPAGSRFCAFATRKLYRVKPLRNVIVVDNLLACDFGSTYSSDRYSNPSGLYHLAERLPHPPYVPTSAETCPTLLQLFIRGNPFGQCWPYPNGAGLVSKIITIKKFTSLNYLR